MAFRHAIIHRVTTPEIRSGDHSHVTPNRAHFFVPMSDEEERREEQRQKELEGQIRDSNGGGGGDV
ncbi:hypothetical protein JCM24511_08080 [Saitozyma sp. JCM 24511]|nr:hypothetical protein JCM24511_08080 [Saitozyma sp. JCM 24511]